MSTARESLSLAEAVTHLLEECRMILPGVQALFGFQLIAVFNSSFAERLSPLEQRVHLLALALVAVAGALIMAPAAYHRQTSPQAVSSLFLLLGGRLMLISLITLMLGIGLDFYLIARLILDHAGTAMAAATALVLFIAACWFGLPRLWPQHR
jgi:hypothetical protein